jgi:UDP-N-acetylglucosamine--N-acetylmuramyl-(pentapeptide) pyrophosphoryl-undecaprenol N-acetylglucosamine transferase
MICVLSSGGTGGHVFPAVALFEALSQDKNITCHFVTDDRGEKFLQKALKDQKIFVPLKRSKLFYLDLLKAFFLSFFYLMKTRPSVVVGFGGYPSFPCVFAAQLLRIPTVIHEQNRYLGKANRFLGKKANAIAVSFQKTRDELQKSYPNKKMIYTGNPIRSEISQLNLKYPPESEIFTILVLGGSQGAKIFSDILPKALAKLSAQPKQLVVFHQCRQEYIDEVKKLYKKNKIEAKVAPFFVHMAALYERTNLVISRSGASTLFELIHTCRPSIFVPFEASKESDQLFNAQTLENAKAAFLLKEDVFSVDTLSQLLEHILGDQESLQQISFNMQSFQNKMSAHHLKNIVLEIGKKC